MAEKNNANKVPRWFSVMEAPKLPPIENRETAKYGPKYAFLVILGQILAFLINLVPCPTKKNANVVPKWLSDMWVPELLLLSKMIRMFGLKTAIFAPKYTFSGTYRPCWLKMPCWLVGWWFLCAGYISCKTPIYFIIMVTILIIHQLRELI